MVLSALILLAVSLGTVGNTYKIVEPDAATEIQHKLSKVDIERVRAELERKYKNYRPEDWKSLPPATKNYSYLVDMTYTLERDIPEVDQNGKIIRIIYPKGYQFNPLEYLPADPPPLVIFNGSIAKEREWVKKNYKENMNVMLVATEGDILKISKELGRPVFYLKSIMAEKLNLKNTISVVHRDNKYMRVDVYAVKSK